ncbi:hypothetical protein QUB35_28560, partial [Microcoleus sp. B13-B6]
PCEEKFSRTVLESGGARESVADFNFLDRDLLPVKVGEKPDNWQPSGKRIKRGLYRYSTGLLINADVNGAANIIRKSKVAIDSISIIERVGRGLLTNPLRIKLWADSSPKVSP